MIRSLNLSDSRTARWAALGLFVLTILLRLPFVSQYLYHWDSVNMAFGMRDYNVPAGAPHYPGYIVYIALANVVDVLFRDPQRTLVFISLVSSGLAAVVLFYFGRELFNPTSGLIASLFLIASPLFWFYGEIALPHALDLLVITVSAWVLYQMMEGKVGWRLWFAPIFLGLVGGFRQQDLMFLAPLILFCCYRLGIRRLAIMLVLGIVTTLAWLLPLLSLSGGLQSYLAGSSAFTASFFDSTSLLAGAGWFGLRRNLFFKLIPYTLYAWSLAAVPALYWLTLVPRRWQEGLRNRKVWFFLLWMAPALGFYIIIHMGQQGLVFVYMPALFLLSAEGLYRWLHNQPGLLRASTAVIFAAGAVVFILLPTYPLGGESFKLLNNSTLRESDADWEAKISTVRERFQPEDTLLVAANWRHLQYYLPEYKFARFNLAGKYDENIGQVIGADFTNTPMTAEELGLTAGDSWQIVVMDSDLLPFAAQTSETIPLANGDALGVLTLRADQAYWTDGQTFGAQP